MNFKSILVVGLSIATLGLALPAHAGEGATKGDTGTVIDNQQGAVVTGNDSKTNQKIQKFGSTTFCAFSQSQPTVGRNVANHLK